MDRFLKQGFLWLVGCLSLLLGPACSLQAQSLNPLHLKTADAVYKMIDKRYYVHRDGSYTLTFHVKIKILTYKGKKDHADFRYPYNTTYQSVKVQRAQTIARNGEIIPVDTKEIHDINDPRDARASIYSREHLKVINFPSVEPGSTVEMTLVVQSKYGFWVTECFRHGDPILRKVVTVSLPVGMPLRIKRPPLKIEEKKTYTGTRIIYRWTAINIPKEVDEPMLPPIENRGICLFLSTFPSWKDVANYFNRLLLTVNGKYIPKPVYGRSPKEVYLHLMKQVMIYPLDFFHTSLKFQSPGVTLKKGYGSQADLALLFYTLLKRKGYAPELLMMNSEGVMLKQFKGMPTPSLFDDIIVRCKGWDYAFFAKDLPPGYTGLQRQWILSLKTGRLIPAEQHYLNRSVTHLTLISTPSFTLQGRFVLRSEGAQAVAIRGWLRYKTRDEWRIASSQILHDIDPIAQPTRSIVKKGLNTLTAPVILMGQFLIPCQFPTLREWSIIPVAKPDIPDSLETLLETRRGPLMIPTDYEEIMEENITLPADFRPCHLPAPLKGSMKVMVWDYHVTSQKNHLLIHRTVHLRRGILYPGTRRYFDFLQAIDSLCTPVNRMVVLEKVSHR